MAQIVCSFSAITVFIEPRCLPEQDKKQSEVAAMKAKPVKPAPVDESSDDSDESEVRVTCVL